MNGRDTNPNYTRFLARVWGIQGRAVAHTPLSAYIGSHEDGVGLALPKPLNRPLNTTKRESMRTPIVVPFLTLSLSLILASCGGSAPNPETAGDVKEGEGTTADSEAVTPTKKDEAKKEEAASTPKEEPKTEEPAITRTAQSRVTAPEVVFMFSFNESDAKAKAEKECDAKAGNNAEKRGACMAAARRRVEADGYHFMQDDKGQWWWLVIRQKGSALAYLHRVPVEFTKDSATSVTLKPTGKDKGTAPWAHVPSEIVIETPNEYQIVVQDPELGRVVYEAKLGLLNAEKAKR